ncbi:hypothetical protein [Hansschlegelia zhihuaiae]|uniref:Uncharacterized protein n=1 Tax=Hansschlegelia zhihuaiae TaxID=405005 RepID=A0A4Q0MCF8_9HYPH|nr:hypothetical protein [Hansschlegelia zhihuaiae]RXF70783.1 hypothetical protein EK403_16500 [Hansschlegelia zhihuaiae]
MRAAVPAGLVLRSAAFAAGLLASLQSGAQAQETAEAMLPVWREANAACLAGQAGAAENRAACARRDHFTNRLSRLGLCYGKQGQAAADPDWHACEADSNRLGR